MEATGRVIAILEKQSGVSKATNREWSSQEYVIEVPGQYPRKICFRLFGEDRINEAHIQMGEEITISFDIDAREWQGRWFTQINAYRVSRNAGMPTDQFPPAEQFPPASQFPPQQQPYTQAQPFNSEPSTPVTNPSDDLPF